MIVWGGFSFDGTSHYLNTGGRYNPSTDNWTATSTTNAPDAREYHTAVWSGSEMIVWGGYFFDGIDHFLNTGGRYNPTTGDWVPTSTTNAPTARWRHTAAWTGSEMIAWGAATAMNVSTSTGTGGQYCAQSGPTPTPSPTPTPTPCTGRCAPTPRPRPTPHPRPTPQR
jgi:hypothetical protein